MTENQTLAAELLANAGKEIDPVDAQNPVDVERYLSDLILAIGNLSQERFDALSPAAQVWLNEVTRAYNSRQNLADVAFGDSRLKLADLPTATAPVSPQTEDRSGDAAQAETPPSAPEKRKAKAQVSKPAGSGKKLAFSRRNPWGNGTKARAVINAVISSNGKAAYDMSALVESADGGVSNASITLSANHALQAFDCMRQAGWLDINNPAVQSFIQTIEDK